MSDPRDTVAPSGVTDHRPHVAVLGAGVCGLYAARTLAGAGARVTLLERESVVGGLAAGRERDGNYYDLGVHHLHAFDREIFEDVRALMGERLLPVEKSAKIRYGRGYRRYPLELFDLLIGIPPWTLATALTGLVAQQLRNRLSRPEPDNAEEALVQLYGRPLYEFFFRDFTHRYWGMPPTELSATFVRRKMPRLSAVDIIKQALGKLGLKAGDDQAVESATREETLYYSPTGAREMPMALADFVRQHGGEVLLEAPATGVVTDGHRVTAVRYRKDGAEQVRPCDACISTIPLPTFVRAFEPDPPVDVLASCDALSYRPIAVFGLLVRRKRVLDALYVYFRDRVFHRIAEPTNSGLVVRPEGHSVLLVETTCEVDDPFWRGAPEALEAITRDLEAEGLLTGDDIVETHIVRTANGYPVFAHGFEPHRDRLLDFVGRFPNAWTTGRQGGFCYPNMHSAMRMGADAAEEALALLERGAEVNGQVAAERAATAEASG